MSDRLGSAALVSGGEVSEPPREADAQGEPAREAAVDEEPEGGIPQEGPVEQGEFPVERVTVESFRCAQRELARIHDWLSGPTTVSWRRIWLPTAPYAPSWPDGGFGTSTDETSSSHTWATSCPTLL
ncbi:hypothetical protein GCM10020367_54930 [Streptomyces sannanensis]|uniref:Uncharacterized protein n=1 Tax=Streptomyces sannanensis TaxID=285536 RepID=A0ABP6SJE5_9ACTN